MQEEIEARHHKVIFYLKFHCDLNFIERFWCSAKHFARENCSYFLESLRNNVLRAIHSVSSKTIDRYHQKYERLISAYADGLTYGTEEFTKRAYNSHRKVTDKSLWQIQTFIHILRFLLSSTEGESMNLLCTYKHARMHYTGNLLNLHASHFQCYLAMPAIHMYVLRTYLMHSTLFDSSHFDAWP